MKELELLHIPIIEWIGYLASTLVLISLSFSSILRLRIFNLFGSLVFSFYGFAIGSFPVGIMNLFIVLFNLYYLQKLFLHKDKFELIETDLQQEYVNKFLKHYKKDIQNYFPGFQVQPNASQLVFMVTRNMNLTGLLIAEHEDRIIDIKLDYVTPKYRDFKNGKYIFTHFRNALKSKKYNLVKTKSAVRKQISYLKKMGFKEENPNEFHLML